MLAGLAQIKLETLPHPLLPNVKSLNLECFPLTGITLEYFFVTVPFKASSVEKPKQVEPEGRCGGSGGSRLAII